MCSTACIRSSTDFERQYALSSSASESEATENTVLSTRGIEAGLFIMHIIPEHETALDCGSLFRAGVDTRGIAEHRLADQRVHRGELGRPVGDSWLVESPESRIGTGFAGVCAVQLWR